jgi:hypothetical protein
MVSTAAAATREWIAFWVVVRLRGTWTAGQERPATMEAAGGSSCARVAGVEVLSGLEARAVRRAEPVLTRAPLAGLTAVARVRPPRVLASAGIKQRLRNERH